MPTPEGCRAGVSGLVRRAQRFGGMIGRRSRCRVGVSGLARRAQRFGGMIEDWLFEVMRAPRAHSNAFRLSRASTRAQKPRNPGPAPPAPLAPPAPFDDVLGHDTLRENRGIACGSIALVPRAVIPRCRRCGAAVQHAIDPRLRERTCRRNCRRPEQCAPTPPCLAAIRPRSAAPVRESPRAVSSSCR